MRETQRPLVLLIGPEGADGSLPDTVFESAGCAVFRVDHVDEAACACAESLPDLVFMPLALEGQSTMALLRSLLSHQPQPVVVALASNDEINLAAEAMRIGAQDCLFKPFSQSRLMRTLDAALRQIARPSSAARGAAPTQPLTATRPARPDRETLAKRPPPGAGLDHRPEAERAESRAGVAGLNLARRGFVASSPQMRAVLETAAAVARSDAPVFLTGEVGTGKTTLAGMVHELSPRARRPFVTLACATLTASGFACQVEGPDGALARAEGGSLYLDEIADLAPDVQAKVLRLIEAAEIGAGHPHVRIIASTGSSPGALAPPHAIRPELFYRLHVAPIELPPLRDRDGDAALVARVRLAESAAAADRVFTGFSETALDMIAHYDWPGNLRELVNVVQALVLVNDGPIVTPDLLPAELRPGLDAPRIANGWPARAPRRGTAPAAFAADRSRGPAPGGQVGAAGPGELDGSAGLGGPAGLDGLVGKTLAEIERAAIEATILAEDGSVPRAAKVLGVAPSTLYRKREAWTKRPPPA